MFETKKKKITSKTNVNFKNFNFYDLVKISIWKVPREISNPIWILKSKLIANVLKTKIQEKKKGFREFINLFEIYFKFLALLNEPPLRQTTLNRQHLVARSEIRFGTGESTIWLDWLNWFFAEKNSVVLNFFKEHKTCKPYAINYQS